MSIIMRAIWKAQRRRERNEAGFTFLEVMAVVAVIAILAILIVPRILASLDRAKASTDASNINMLKNAIERYRFDNNGAPPANLDALVTGKYIDQVPKTPWGNAYEYTDGMVTSPDVNRWPEEMRPTTPTTAPTS